VYVNNVKVEDSSRVLGASDFLHGRVAVLRRGRRSLAAARHPEHDSAVSTSSEGLAPTSA
jgi:hypothetical protein